MGKSVLARLGLALLLVVVALSGLACQSAAPAYPTKDIDVVVPWPAGGQIDTIARAASEPAQKTLGKSANVRNLVGGGGTIGIAEVANAKPDGHTVAVFSIGPVVLAKPEAGQER